MTAKTCQNLPKIIVLVATELEATVFSSRGMRGVVGYDLEVVVGGMGPVNTALALSAAVARSHRRPVLLLQVGICGAVDRSLNLGEVVAVGSDYLAEYGAWRGTLYAGFHERFQAPRYVSQVPVPQVKTVAGRTVVMACNPLIDGGGCGAQVESMEGAAFFQTAGELGLRALQLRAVSNYIDQPRDEWEIPLALNNLALEIPKILLHLHYINIE